MQFDDCQVHCIPNIIIMVIVDAFMCMCDTEFLLPAAVLVSFLFINIFQMLHYSVKLMSNILGNMRFLTTHQMILKSKEIYSHYIISE